VRQGDFRLSIGFVEIYMERGGNNQQESLARKDEGGQQDRRLPMATRRRAEAG
jgi:hypothetical protein